jgi:hypothetical protein
MMSKMFAVPCEVDILRHATRHLPTGGSRITELREESAAHITVAAEPLPQSNERLVTVTGAAESIGRAITAIVGILHKNRVRGTVIPFHPQVRLQHFQYNAVCPHDRPCPPRISYFRTCAVGYHEALGLGMCPFLMIAKDE